MQSCLNFLVLEENIDQYWYIDLQTNKSFKATALGKKFP